jgi:peroxiredoxin
LASEIDAIRSAGFDVIAISADTAEDARRMGHTTGDTLIVLADPCADLIRRVGLADQDDEVNHLIARPAAFVIDDRGVVRYRYVSRSASDRPTAALISLAAESLASSRRKES